MIHAETLGFAQSLRAALVEPPSAATVIFATKDAVSARKKSFVTPTRVIFTKKTPLRAICAKRLVRLRSLRRRVLSVKASRVRYARMKRVVVAGTASVRLTVYALKVSVCAGMRLL